MWCGAVYAEEGQKYSFKFVVGDEWVTSRAWEREQDGGGHVNNVLRVPWGAGAGRGKGVGGEEGGERVSVHVLRRCEDVIPVRLALGWVRSGRVLVLV